MIRHFNRYELKYILTHKEHLQVAKALEGFLERDRHAGDKGLYRIASLYYDSLACPVTEIRLTVSGTGVS